MISKLPYILAMTIIPLCGSGGGAAIDTTPTLERMAPVSSVTGCVLSWGGPGSPDALLGPQTLARVGIRLEDPAGAGRRLSLDGRGAFQAVDLSGGVYRIFVYWDGNEVYRQALKIGKMSGLALEIRLQELNNGVRVAVRTVGADPENLASRLGSEFNVDSTLEAAGIRLDDDDIFGEDDMEQSPGSSLPPQMPAVNLDDSGPWSSKSLPVTFPDPLQDSMMIDPDINVSKLNLSDPMGLGGGDIRAI